MTKVANAQEIVSPHPAEGLPIPQESLTIEERNQAISLVAPHISSVSMLELMRLSDGREREERPHTVLSNVRLIQETPEDEELEVLGGRLALVTLYRYEDDVTLFQLVDFTSNQILVEEKQAGLTPPLARVENDLARVLVLDDSRIQETLGAQADEVDIETLLTRTTDESNPFFGHRVVYVLFKSAKGYLSTPGPVFVDLTDSVVIIGEI